MVPPPLLPSRRLDARELQNLALHCESSRVGGGEDLSPALLNVALNNEAGAVIRNMRHLVLADVAGSGLSNGLLTNPIYPSTLPFVDALSPLSNLTQTNPLLGGRVAVDPLVAARLSLAQAAAEERYQLQRRRQEALIVDEAYKRGREEALLSLSLAQLREPDQINKPVGTETTIGRASLARNDPARNERALEALGTSSIERRKVNAPYFDASQLKDPDPHTVANRRTRGGVTEPFPEKLHRMLAEVEERGESDVISFLPHGRAFVIHHAERFCREIMPRYFKQSRLSSFQRQLNLYGFTRITSGSDVGGYYHELFLQGRPALAIHMRRVGVPQSEKANRRGRPSPHAAIGSSTTATAPDFYNMQPVMGAANSGGSNDGTEESEDSKKPAAAATKTRPHHS